MDDGECSKRSTHVRGIGFISFIILTQLLYDVNSLDIEIENMRREGLEKHDVSIFVEERVEYIHSRILLGPLITGIDHANKLSIGYGVRANSSLGKILNSRINKLVARVENKLGRVYGKRSRKVVRRRRAIKFIGNLMSKMFGIPGPEEWEQNTRNTLAMKAAIERQQANSGILHQDIDENRHAINEQNELLRHLSREAFNNENRLDKVDNALTEFETYLEIESMFNSIDEILESLNDIVKDSKTGRCNEKGLNPEFLIEHLRVIESNKNSIAPIFASWEWQKYYFYDMCTVALHDDEIWITIRIPIVNLVEQFVRAVPMSNQIWISDTMNALGIETSLFKMKQLDVFMLVTKTNLEMCSKLGFSRVCNVRKTRFREFDPYIAPLDINHGRTLLITNSTDSKYDIKSLCTSSPDTLIANSHSILKVPDKCAIISKAFEISRIATNRSISTQDNVGEIEAVILRSLDRNLSNFQPSNRHNLPKLSSEFEANNNITTEKLKEINTNWNTGSLLITASSSTTTMLAIILAVILVIRCSRKCKSKNNDQVTLRMENFNREECNSKENREIAIETIRDIENADSANTKRNFEATTLETSKEFDSAGLGPKFNR